MLEYMVTYIALIWTSECLESKYLEGSEAKRTKVLK